MNIILHTPSLDNIILHTPSLPYREDVLVHDIDDGGAIGRRRDAKVRRIRDAAQGNICLPMGPAWRRQHHIPTESRPRASTPPAGAGMPIGLL